ncbi:MAG: NUDIX hydrolase [Deltaproteobacteria bacterium]|nr:NUDIX hydrolase [Deltaproteobacteria bacterium]
MKRELVAGLVIREGRVLLVHNLKHGHKRVEPPGGKIHAGEADSEALAREMEEELGIRAEPIRLLGVYPTHSPEGEFTVRMYVCGIVEGEPRVAEPEKIPSFGWYGMDELRRLKAEGCLVPNMAEAMEDLEGLLA